MTKTKTKKSKKEPEKECPDYFHLGNLVYIVLREEGANDFDALAALEIARSMVLTDLICPHSGHEQHHDEGEDIPEPTIPVKKTKSIKSAPELSIAGYC